MTNEPQEQTQKILLVEDSTSDAYIVQDMLGGALAFIKYDFTTVPRLSEALERLDAERFAAVLLDLNLIDSKGVATVSALRNSYPDLPIIVYSGTDDVSIRQQAMMCGATHFAVKGRESGFVIKFMIQQAIAA